MSDNFRQGFTDKAEATFKPDSEKTTTEHIGDKIQGKADSAASTAQPEVRIDAYEYCFVLMQIVFAEREVICPAGRRRHLRKSEREPR